MELTECYHLKTPPRALVLSGNGLNCETETAHAFKLAGGQSDIVHIQDLVDKRFRLLDYQILAIPGGFSYGDDTGSGNAMANRIRNHLWEGLMAFVSSDRLVIGICNGFQILTNLGMFPGKDGKYGERNTALVHNEKPRYHTRWVDVAFSGTGPWTRNIGTVALPVAHGEGRFYSSAEVLARLKTENQIVGNYTQGEMHAHFGMTANPNGSLEDIAAITDWTGRVIGMMPHPERAVSFFHLPHWPLLNEQYKRRQETPPTIGPGLKLFQNAIEYFG